MARPLKKTALFLCEFPKRCVDSILIGLEEFTQKIAGQADQLEKLFLMIKKRGTLLYSPKIDPPPKKKNGFPIFYFKRPNKAHKNPKISEKLQVKVVKCFFEVMFLTDLDGFHL